MIGREFRFHNGGKGAALAVRVNTGGAISQIIKVLKDGTVWVTLENQPVDLNQELIGFLSEQLRIPAERFDVIAGEEGEDKLISILDVTPETIQDLVLRKLS